MARRDHFEHRISQGLKRWIQAGEGDMLSVDGVEALLEVKAPSVLLRMAQEEGYGVLTNRRGPCNINSRRRLRWR